MVDFTIGTLALMIGFLCSLLPALIAPSLPMDLQQRFANFYYSLGAKALGQIAFVHRRINSSWELHSLSINADREQGEVTISSSLVGDDKKIEFKNPDNRIHRLFSKPTAVVIEGVPAVVDPELLEVGYWRGRKKARAGLVDTEAPGAGGDVEAVYDPYFPMDDKLRACNPADIAHVLSSQVEPADIQTAKSLTKERFSKYGRDVGAMEAGLTMLGAAWGAGIMAVLYYFQVKIVGGSSSDPGDVTTIPLGFAQLPVGVVDHAATLVTWMVMHT